MSNPFDAPIAAVFLAIGNIGFSGRFTGDGNCPMWQTDHGMRLPINLNLSGRSTPDHIGHDLFYSIASAWMTNEKSEAAFLAEYEGWVAFCRNSTRLKMIQTWPWLAPIFALIDERMEAAGRRAA